jgi:hypothetical protein
VADQGLLAISRATAVLPKSLAKRDRRLIPHLTSLGSVGMSAFGSIAEWRFSATGRDLQSVGFQVMQSEPVKSALGVVSRRFAPEPKVS